MSFLFGSPKAATPQLPPIPPVQPRPPVEAPSEEPQEIVLDNARRRRGRAATVATTGHGLTTEPAEVSRVSLLGSSS